MEDPFEPPFATIFNNPPVEDEDEMRELWEGVDGLEFSKPYFELNNKQKIKRYM